MVPLRQVSKTLIVWRLPSSKRILESVPAEPATAWLFLPPHRLVNLIEQELTFGSPCDPNWRILFTQTKPERVRLLVDSLGLELEIQEESLIHT